VFRWFDPPDAAQLTLFEEGLVLLDIGTYVVTAYLQQLSRSLCLVFLQSISTENPLPS
jgi:hypothetical protein